MEQIRSDFWAFFLEETSQDVRQVFLQGPLPFRQAAPSVFDKIRRDLAIRLEAILLPMVVAFVQADRAQSTDSASAYLNLFNSKHSETLSRLKEFHSPTVSLLYQYLRVFRLHVGTLCVRLFSDWDAICSAFDLTEVSTLVAADLMAGDPHNQGEQTAIFRFDSGGKGLVYKPVDVGVDELLRSLLTQIRTGFHGHSPTRPRTLQRHQSGQSYGYVEYISYQGRVASHEQARSLFRQFGELLAFGKGLSISDGHYDNLLIHDDEVIWLDLETAFNFFDDPRVHPIEKTGLLLIARPETTALGIATGLQGGVLPRVSLTYPTVHADGTDQMFIRYFALRDVKSHNQVYLGDQACALEDFVEDIKFGYATMAEAMRRYASQIEHVIQAAMHHGQVRVRHILQATASYARSCALLRHYAGNRRGNTLLRISNERQKTLSAQEQPFAKFIVENELMDLTNGQIPYFYRSSSSRALYHISGAFRPDFFQLSLLDEVLKHLRETCEASIEDDLRFIDEAIVSTAGIRGWDQFAERFHFPVFDFQEKLQSMGMAG